jgi:lipopolysaccharide biosynthesis glycosyltransferase
MHFIKYVDLMLSSYITFYILLCSNKSTFCFHKHISHIIYPRFFIQPIQKQKNTSAF